MSSKIPREAGRVNRAVLWHLRMSRWLLDRLRCYQASAHVSAAIDAFVFTANLDEETSDLELDEEERVKIVLEMFRKHRKLDKPDDESSEQ